MKEKTFNSKVVETFQSASKVMNVAKTRPGKPSHGLTDVWRLGYVLMNDVQHYLCKYKHHSLMCHKALYEGESSADQGGRV